MSSMLLFMFIGATHLQTMVMTRSISWDLSRGPVVKNLLSNVGDVGLIPGRGTKSSHDLGPGSPSSTAREARMPPQRPSTAKQRKQKQNQDLFLEDPPRAWSGGCLKRRSKDKVSAVRVILT